MSSSEWDIEKKVKKLAKIIQASAGEFPAYGESEDYTRPYIEINDQGLHWVVVEHGKELERRTTNTEDGLLYWIFEPITHGMASKYSAKHRKKYEDFRRQLFEHQLMLLERLNLNWKIRREKKYVKY